MYDLEKCHNEGQGQRQSLCTVKQTKLDAFRSWDRKLEPTLKFVSVHYNI